MWREAEVSLSRESKAVGRRGQVRLDCGWKEFLCREKGGSRASMGLGFGRIKKWGEEVVRLRKVRGGD